MLNITIILGHLIQDLFIRTYFLVMVPNVRV